MVRYLCQYCNCTYVDYHKCFSYNNYDKICSFPQKHKIYKKDSKNGRAKKEFRVNSNEKCVKIIPIVHLSDTEELEQVNYLPSINNEQIPLKKTSKRQGNLFSLPEVTYDNSQFGKRNGTLASNSTRNTKEDEICPEEKDYPKYSSQNVGLYCGLKSDFYGACSGTTNVPVVLSEKHNRETRSSSPIHETSAEESEMEMDATPGQPFTNDKLFLIEPSDGSSHDIHPDSKLISETSNILEGNAVSPEDQENGTYAFEKSTPLKEASHVLETCDNFKKNLVFKKERESDKYTFEISRNLSDIPMPSERVALVYFSGIINVEKNGVSLKQKESDKHIFEMSRNLRDNPMPSGSVILALAAANVEENAVSLKQKESDKCISEMSRNLPAIFMPSKRATPCCPSLC